MREERKGGRNREREIDITIFSTYHLLIEVLIFHIEYIHTCVIAVAVAPVHSSKQPFQINQSVSQSVSTNETYNSIHTHTHTYIHTPTLTQVQYQKPYLASCR